MTIDTTKLMNFPEIYSATGMMELIQQIGFLPLLDSGIEGFSAEDIVAEDCGYVRLPEGGWDWPLWKWKGEIVQEMLHIGNLQPRCLRQKSLQCHYQEEGGNRFLESDPSCLLLSIFLEKSCSFIFIFCT